MLTERERKILRIVGDYITEINTNKIAEKLGTTDNLKAALLGLIKEKYLTRQHVKNRWYYKLTGRGKKEVGLQIQRSLIEDYATLLKLAPDLKKIATGQIEYRGPNQKTIYHDDGTKEFLVKFPNTDEWTNLTDEWKAEALKRDKERAQQALREKIREKTGKT